MLDNNTVINGLGIIRNFFEIGQPSQSAIFDSYQNIIDGAIQLLKEQQNKREVDTPIICIPRGSGKSRLMIVRDILKSYETGRISEEEAEEFLKLLGFEFENSITENEEEAE